MKEIAQGAEAKIYLDEDKIIKERIPKKYRIKELDESIRKFRTRREAKILKKLSDDVKHPGLIKMDDKKMFIEMEHIKGEKLRDIFDKNIRLAEEIGKKVAIMHNQDIIHGDLTTSNMIYDGNEIFFIDFGLGFFSIKYEDKAVDLHLLKQALESKHHKIFNEAVKLVFKGYKQKSKDYEEVMERLKKVESRGRNK